MKTNTTQQLYELARQAAMQWYVLAVNAPQTYSLWWRSAKAGESIAPPVIAAKSPGDGYTQSISLSMAWSKETAATKIYEALYSLPILGRA